MIAIHLLAYAMGLALCALGLVRAFLGAVMFLRAPNTRDRRTQRPVWQRHTVEGVGLVLVGIVLFGYALHVPGGVSTSMAEGIALALAALLAIWLRWQRGGLPS